jgi:hypothetical protein
MVKTRIACYFDIPRADNKSDYHNFVDVRRWRRNESLSLRASSEKRASSRDEKKPPRLPRALIAVPRDRETVH